MKKFAGHKSHAQIKRQCEEQGVPLNDRLYREQGWDTIVVGSYPNGGYALYNTVNGTFFGWTPKGVFFESGSAQFEDEPWFQALLSFFYIEKDAS